VHAFDRRTDGQTDRRTDRRTDGQTDRNLIARPHLHSMQRGKKTVYDPMECDLRLILKGVEDFLLVVIELFSLGVTADALQANIGSKSAISL